MPQIHRVLDAHDHWCVADAPVARSPGCPRSTESWMPMIPGVLDAPDTQSLRCPRCSESRMPQFCRALDAHDRDQLSGVQDAPEHPESRMPVFETPVVRSLGCPSSAEPWTPMIETSCPESRMPPNTQSLGCPCSRPQLSGVSDAQLSGVQDAQLSWMPQFRRVSDARSLGCPHTQCLGCPSPRSPGCP